MEQLAIGIPTRHRCGMLLELLDDIVQHAPHLPVVISDNSLDDETEAAIAHYQNRLNLQYFHIRDSLSQAENFNFLLSKVDAKYVLMMHDDDRFLTDSVADYQGIVDYLEAQSLNVFAIYVNGLKFWHQVPSKSAEVPAATAERMTYVQNRLRIFQQGEYLNYFVEHGKGGKAAGVLVNRDLMAAHDILFPTDTGAKHDKGFFLTTNLVGAVAHWQKRAIAIRLHDSRSTHRLVTQNYILFNRKLEQIYGKDSKYMPQLHRQRFQKWQKAEPGFVPFSCLRLLASARLPFTEKLGLLMVYCKRHLAYRFNTAIANYKT